MTTDQIIARLGGREALMQLTGASAHAVSQWRRIGLPYKHFELLVNEGKRRGVRGITLDRLHAAKAASLGRSNGTSRAA